MKKITVGFAAVFAALFLFSCKSAPAPAPAAEEEFTQEAVNEALTQIFDTHRPSLDLTGAQQYTVVRRDTLSQIARRFYGNLTNVGIAGERNGFFFPIIMMASGSNIVDPDLIRPGMRLTIPDLRRNLDNPSSRDAIRNSLLQVAEIYSKKNRPVEVEGLRRLANSL